MSRRSKLLLFVCLFGVVSCATTAPKSQMNSFDSRPVAFTAAVSEQKIGRDIEEKIKSQDNQIKTTQSDYKAVQNGLFDLSGEVTAVKAQMDSCIREINGVREANVTGVKSMENRLNATADLFSSAVLNLRAELKADLKAEVNAALLQQSYNSQSGRDTRITQNSIWTYVVFACVTLLVVCIFGGVVVFIFNKLVEAKVEAKISSVKTDLDQIKASAVVLPAAYKINTESDDSTIKAGETSNL